jgi:hypothetical protein
MLATCFHTWQRVIALIHRLPQRVATTCNNRHMERFIVSPSMGYTVPKPSLQQSATAKRRTLEPRGMQPHSYATWLHPRLWYGYSPRPYWARRTTMN